MERYSNKVVEKYDQEAADDLRKYYGHIKYVPFAILCTFWAVIVKHAFGNWAAFPAILIGGLFLGGYIKGVWKSLGALLLALLLPVVVAAFIGH